MIAPTLANDRFAGIDALPVRCPETLCRQTRITPPPIPENEETAC
jgi:hypothetical protein